MSGKGATFRALHQEPGGFIIPNPWDIGTARILAGMGFRALATTSAGLALVRENYAVVLERIGRSAEAAAIRRQSEQARVASRQVPVEVANT